MSLVISLVIICTEWMSFSFFYPGVRLGVVILVVNQKRVTARLGLVKHDFDFELHELGTDLILHLTCGTKYWIFSRILLAPIGQTSRWGNLR